MNDFARAVTWRLAEVEARPPRPGDTALLAALAEEARCSLAPLRARRDAARHRGAVPGGGGAGTLVQLELWERREAA